MVKFEVRRCVDVGLLGHADFISTVWMGHLWMDLHGFPLWNPTSVFQSPALAVTAVLLPLC